MGGANGHCKAIVGHLRELVGLLLGERGVGSDDGEGSVLEGRGRNGSLKIFEKLDAVKEPGAARVTGAGDDAAGLRVDDAAQGVDRDEGPDGVFTYASACAAEAALNGTFLAEGLTYGCARTCAYGALDQGRRCRL